MSSSSDSKTYYDHDFIWAQRKAARHPVWGSNSHRVYRRVLGIIEGLHVPSKTSVLDVGCGAGAFGPVVLAAGYDYVGVDASKVAIELGKQSYPGVRLYAADFVDADFISSTTERFAVITSINALHCLVGDAERLAFLRNIAAMGHPDAYLILTTMIGPVGEGAADKRLPRAYKLANEIISELATCGWHTPQIIEQTAADEYSKIGNLVIVAQLT